MKIKVFLILFAVIFTSITLKSDTQVTVAPDTPFKLKVCVYVRPDDDTDLDTRLEAFLRRELRVLGDVEIVKMDSDWHYLLAFAFFEVERKDGTKTSMLSIASAVMAFHPDISHKTYRFPEYGKPALFESITAAYWSADNLHELAIQAIGDFDTSFLEPLRQK